MSGSLPQNVWLYVTPNGAVPAPELRPWCCCAGEARACRNRISKGPGGIGVTIRKGNGRTQRIEAAPAKEWKEYLLDPLKDPREAAEYLNAALEDRDPAVFLLALRHVAEAHGIGKLAGRSKLNREHAYRILSNRGNPQLSSLSALLEALDLRLAIEPKTTPFRRRRRL